MTTTECARRLYRAVPSRVFEGSWNVIEVGRLNEWGEPWVEVPAVTEWEAKETASRMNAERNVVDRVVQGTADAYRQGYRGYYRGDRYADCPYPEGRKERAAGKEDDGL